MVYNLDAAERLRKLVRRRKHVTEKKMFGGVGFLLNGNMCVGIWQDYLILRVGVDAYRALLSQDHTHEFDITGRPMRGWVMVAPDGYLDNEQLKLWIEHAFEFVRSLPPK